MSSAQSLNEARLQLLRIANELQEAARRSVHGRQHLQSAEMNIRRAAIAIDEAVHIDARAVKIRESVA